MAITQLNTTELDFEKIKTNLKSYLKNSDSTFKDYDFEGSGLNHLIDILAYNTHYNAINAHMSVNESFIDTAQVRSNVVSHAKLVGYTPKSASTARATISLKLTRDSGTDSSVTLNAGTTFTTSVGGENFIFQTLTDNISDRYNATTGNFEFDSIEIYEGSRKSIKFYFNDNNNEKFSIPENSVDTSTLIVTVKDSNTASVGSETYKLYNRESAITGTSRVYYLSERFDGLYEIEFGNNVLGKKPIANSVITVSYLTCSLDGPNGAATFTLSGSTPANTSEAESGSITTISSATGGADKETVSSIKFNAPRSFIAQNRAVTLGDYDVMVREAIADVQDVAVYGGQDIIPPQYGKVFISVKPKSGLFLTQGQKNAILSFLARKKIVTVIPEVVDADYTYLYFNLTSKYNSSLTSLTRKQLETAIRSSISGYNTTFLSSYGNNFRFSKLLTSIDNTDASIGGTIGQVYAYKRTTLIPGSTAASEISFGFRLLGGVDQAGSFITSSAWSFKGRTYYLEDTPITGDSEKRNIRLFYINDLNIKVVENASVGFLYPMIGKITLEALSTDVETNLDITVIPLSYDIPGIENKLITIDLSKTSIVGDSNLNSESGPIITSDYISAPSSGAAQGVSAASVSTASGVFVPHTMYDPNTGVAYYAATEALHIEYANRGYVHYIPNVVAQTTIAQDISITSSETAAAGTGSGLGTAGSTTTSGVTSGVGGTTTGATQSTGQQQQTTQQSYGNTGYGYNTT